MELKNKTREVGQGTKIDIFTEDREEDKDELKQILSLFSENQDPEQIVRILHEQGLYD